MVLVHKKKLHAKISDLSAPKFVLTLFSGPIALDVEYTVRFIEEKWHYTMYYGDRELATAIKKKIRENVSIYFLLLLNLGCFANPSVANEQGMSY